GYATAARRDPAGEVAIAGEGAARSTGRCAEGHGGAPSEDRIPVGILDGGAQIGGEGPADDGTLATPGREHDLCGRPGQVGLVEAGRCDSDRGSDHGIDTRCRVGREYRRRGHPTAVRTAGRGVEAVEERTAGTA